MGLRERNGKWHYRFMVAGAWYSDNTGLVATERNKTAASRVEAEAHKLVSEGRAHLLKLRPIRFSEAAEKFLSWVDAEYREHPNSAKRIRTSFASLGEFFKREMVATVTPGSVEDFKAYRRACPKCKNQRPGVLACEACGGTGDGVREVTIRHDLHSLSVFFQYARKHNWVKDNPVREVEIPSDEDAVRIHPLTPNEETLYFSACEKKMAELQASRKPRPGGKQGYNGFQDLADLGRLMIQQGCRPEELLALQQPHVDLERGILTIIKGKSNAAKRTLRLRPASKEILARRLGAVGRWVFPSPRRHGEHVTKLNNRHVDVLKECHLKFVPYDFRHTFATRAADAGMPLGTLAKILGHGNLRSVLKYVHPDQGSMDLAMEALDKPRPVEETKDRGKAQPVN
jgi:integrase